MMGESKGSPGCDIFFPERRSIMAYEDYRASVLEALGEDYTVEDLKNFAKFRDKVLTALGIEHTREDTRNEERFRLMFLSGLSGGGGGAELLASKEIDVTTSSTTATVATAIDIPDADKVFADNMILVVCRDKAGKRNGYFWGSIGLYCAEPNISLATVKESPDIFYADGNGIINKMHFNAGVFVTKIDSRSSGSVEISSKYSSSYSRTIDGTFVCEVYAIPYPDFSNPYEAIQ